MMAHALALALALAAQAAPTPAAAAPETPAQRAARFEQMKLELASRRAAVADLDNKERSLVASMGELDESLARLTEESDAANKRQGALRAEQAELKARTGLDEEELKAARARLDARLRAMVVDGEGGTARALLGAEGFVELALRRRLLRTLAESDARLVDDVHRAEQAIATRRARLKDAEREAEQIAKELDEQRALIAATRDERHTALSRIKSERALAERAEKELTEKRAQLASLMGRLSEESRSAPAPARPAAKRGKGILKGRLPWPVEGAVIRRFGTTVDKDSRAEIVSNGLEIRAEQGAPVQAVADARVAHVGWLRGFGRVVILDHGEGHHTLSAHLERAAVETGDDVRAGQTIGFVGDTESNNGAKLYFELRENGRPRDPSPVLR
jgi:murein hydrolase activator